MFIHVYSRLFHYNGTKVISEINISNE